MQMFVFWSVEKIEEHIQHLEELIAAGAQAANEGSTGGATFMTLSQNKSTLQQLYDRWEEKTGQKVQPDRRALTVINVDVGRYY